MKDQNNFNIPQKKYIQKFESYNTNEELERAVDIFMSIVNFIESNFSFYKKYFNSENFSYMIKMQINLVDTSEWSHHPLNYTSIHSDDFKTREDVKELIYLKNNITYRILWDIKGIEVAKIIFDINIGTDKTYRLDSEDILSIDLIDKHKKIMDNQKDLLNELKNIPQQNLKTSGYHFPNFWAEYVMELDLHKKSEDIIKGINED